MSSSTDTGNRTGEGTYSAHLSLCNEVKAYSIDSTQHLRASVGILIELIDVYASAL